MDAYTKVGGEVFNWSPLRVCSLTAQRLWIALWVSQRRVLPGLWVAGLPAIADMAKMQPDDTLSALDELIADRDLAEYDRDREVLRFTEFPDRCERPSNGRHIRALWTRFRAVPQCPVRDSHVRSLEWLLADPAHPPTQDHIDAWVQTFGSITVPIHRHRGVRRLLDSDTSTNSQPSLFQKPEETLATLQNSIPYAIPYTDTHRSTIRDQRSEISGSGESNPDANFTPSGEISDPLHPPLALVPLFTVSDMLAAVALTSAGRFSAGPVDSRLAEELSATVRACEQQDVGLEDLRLVGRWLAAGGLGFRSDLGPVWAARPGALLDSVGQARAWTARGEGPVGERSRRGSVPAAEPAPASAFGSGRRTL